MVGNTLGQDWHKETAVAQSVNCKNAKQVHYISVLGLNFVVKAVLFSGNEILSKNPRPNIVDFAFPKTTQNGIFLNFALQLMTFCRNDSLFLHQWLSELKETTKVCFKTKVDTWFSCLRKI